MPSKIKTKRKLEVAQSLGSVMSCPWSIYEGAIGEFLTGLNGLLSRGEVPGAGTNLPKAAATLQRTRIQGSRTVIQIVGVIQPEPNFVTEYYGGTACSEIRMAISQAVNDPRCTEIVLMVNSPGGSVFGLEETATVIASAAKQKRVVAAVNGLCASAAYYLVSGASEIVASPSSAVGSIGSVIMHADWSKAFSDYGITHTAIQFGQFKTDGNPYTPLTSQGKATIQEFVDSYGDQFVDAVAKNRGIPRQTVLEQYGQGKVFIAQQALNRKMIDRIGSIEIMEPPTSGPVSESNIVAGDPVKVSIVSTEQTQVKKLKAQLFALGLIGSIDATDELSSTAMAAFAAAKGVEVPRAQDGSLDEDKCCRLLRGQSEPAAIASPINPLQAAHNREQGEAREMTAAQFKQRRDEIEASAALINFGRSTPIVSSEMIRAAVDGTQSVSEISSNWRNTIENNPKGGAVNPPVNVVTGGERFTVDAVECLFEKHTGNASSKKYGELAFMSLSDIARRCLQISGDRTMGEYANREQVALAALQLGQQSQGRVEFGSSYGMVGASYNRPGDFPNLLSSLAGKVLDTSIEAADVSYQDWTDRMSDTTDFKPSVITAMGVFTTMDDLKDDEQYKSLKMNEELRGFISVERKGNAVGMTPIMVANDDLDGFMQQLQSLGYAHEATINELCIALLENNVLLADNVALFHASHGNIVSGGGAPSATQAEKNMLLHDAQTVVGGGRTIKNDVKVVLVPSAHWVAARQTYQPFRDLGETKTPTADTSLNVFRDQGIKVVKETGLSNSSKWYTFADPRKARVIAHRFMAGYGKGGQRVTWFDTSRGTRYYGLEGRFGVSAVGYRGVVQNPGS